MSPLKTILPVAAFFCFLQGIAEVGRCVLCLKQGKWPERLHDVEEMEDQILRELQEREHAIEHQLHLDEESTGGKP